jgi:hypothetical protein
MACRRVLDALIRTIEQCRIQCKNLCQQGFMKAMFTASRNTKSLDKLIKEVDSRMADVHLRVSSTQLALAVEMDSKMDAITKMMEKMAAGAHGKEDPADMDPNILAEIAKQAGMEAGRAMQDELGAMSARMMAKMDEIADAVKGKVACDTGLMLLCCYILTPLSTAVSPLYSVQLWTESSTTWSELRSFDTPSLCSLMSNLIVNLLFDMKSPRKFRSNR